MSSKAAAAKKETFYTSIKDAIANSDSRCATLPEIYAYIRLNSPEMTSSPSWVSTERERDIDLLWRKTRSDRNCLAMNGEWQKWQEKRLTAVDSIGSSLVLAKESGQSELTSSPLSRHQSPFYSMIRCQHNIQRSSKHNRTPTATCTSDSIATNHISSTSRTRLISDFSTEACREDRVTRIARLASILLAFRLRLTTEKDWVARHSATFHSLSSIRTQCRRVKSVGSDVKVVEWERVCFLWINTFVEWSTSL